MLKDIDGQKVLDVLVDSYRRAHHDKKTMQSYLDDNNDNVVDQAKFTIDKAVNEMLVISKISTNLGIYYDFSQRIKDLGEV